MKLVPPQYSTNFDDECYICGTSPTVVVDGHPAPQTHLCGIHFFGGERAMKDWMEWNLRTEDTE